MCGSARSGPNLYRAVDEAEQVVDMLLREKRDLESAEAFFEQAIKPRGVVPSEVVTEYEV